LSEVTIRTTDHLGQGTAIGYPKRNPRPLRRRLCNINHRDDAITLLKYETDKKHSHKNKASFARRFEKKKCGMDFRFSSIARG
jgi:hypothetical protein